MSPDSSSESTPEEIKRIVGYFSAVAPRMVPFMKGRDVAVRSTGSGIYARSEGRGPIRVNSEEELVRRVEGGAVTFFVSPVDDSGEVWFSLKLEPRGVPFEVVRLTALKLLLVLLDLELDGLTVFDGNEGIELLWTYGVLAPDDLCTDIWSFQLSVLKALQVRLEKRLQGTPERERIGRWIGWDSPVTGLEKPVEGRGSGAGEGVVLSSGAVSPDDLIRVPFSLNEETLQASVPVTQSDLYRFQRERDSDPRSARLLRRRFEMPLNFPRHVTRALLSQEED